ncbi:uncharacterized protein LAESUDRAFT_754825 [Laetiporus sulphureus 93-53]|uniref:Uncharacterized protein n=1 Tax=Laetiporus sulphureus 93-53 TaxID=1314785 RepID=A0A165H212_9APHY|nr:uncharacterized protein LAESUDRAFT_754825 [Laetiporus sulphureus 93-53]KZT11135.1 hypothetical protein LAESUDRAFT_754825 [Laetiporus sulphureus 93-53]
MARVSFDAEFMKQILPSVPLDHAKTFQVVRDEQSRSLIFSIGTDSTLFFLRPGGTNGQTFHCNLSKAFGLSKSSVVHQLSVLQGEDMSIFLAFSVDGEKPNDPATVYVVRPTKPAEWLDMKADAILTDWLLQGASDEKYLIKSLYLVGAADTTKGYPLLVAIHTQPDESRLDAALLDIDVGSKTWTYSNIFELPEEPSKITAMCAAVLPDSLSGVVYLSESSGKTRLTFAGFRGGAHNEPYSTKLFPPPEAQSIATFVTKEGFTDLVIGGKGLYHYTSRQIANLDNPSGADCFATVVEDDPYLTQLRQINIAQSGGDMTVFGRNGDDTVVYQRCSVAYSGPEIAQLVIKERAIPLITREQGGGHFTVLLDSATGSQKLFVVGEKNQLTQLEHSGTTRLWQRILVLVPSAGDNKEIVSYTTHIHVTDKSGVAITNKKFLLCSSAAVDIGINGGSIFATPSGVLVTTDMSGDITLIHNVTGLSSVVFTFKDDPHGDTVLGKEYVINPSAKAQSKLGAIKSGDDLRSVQLPNGGKLLDHSTASSGDIDMVAKALPQLCRTLSAVPQDGSEHPEGGASGTYYFSLSDISDWGAREWVTKAVKTVGKFFVDASNFVIEIAGKVYTFVLKSLSHIFKAIHWLLQDVLHIPIDKIIEWLGFVFEWGDILDTHNIISGIVTTAMDIAIAKVETFEQVIDGWFQQADFMISALDAIPGDVRDRLTGPSEVNAEYQAADKTTSVNNAPGSNWSSYQIKHGGVKESFSAQGGDAPASGDPLVQFWNDVAFPAFDQIRKTMQDAMQDLARVFDGSKQFSLGQLLDHFGVDLLRNILGVIRQVFVGLIKFAADFATDMRAAITKSLDIPLLTPLYKWITHGHQLTILDAVSLLVAVPLTVVYKLITGQKPSDSPDAKEFIQMSKQSHVSFMSTFAAPSSAYQSEAFMSIASSAPPSRHLSPLGIDVDELIKKLKPIVLRIISIAVPIVNGIILLLAPADWYLSDTTAESQTIKWGWTTTKVAIKVIVCVGTYPWADVPGHPNLHLCRQLTWGLNMFSIFAVPCPVRVRGVVSLALGLFQLVPEGASVPWAIESATDGSYGGNLAGDTVWADISDRLFALVGTAGGGACMLMTKPDPYSFGFAWMTSEAAIICETIKAVKFEPTASEGMPQASLQSVF